MTRLILGSGGGVPYRAGSLHATCFAKERTRPASATVGHRRPTSRHRMVIADVTFEGEGNPTTESTVRGSDVAENGHLCWRRRRRRAGLHDGLISSRKLPQALVCIKLACMFNVGHVAVSHVSSSLHFDRFMNGVITSPCRDRRVCETVLGHARFMLSVETHEQCLLE